MECENRLCCYYENGRCVLPCIRVNAWGMCNAQILVEWEEKILEKTRREYRKIFEGNAECDASLLSKAP